MRSLPAHAYTPPEQFPALQIAALFFASLTSALPLTSLFPYVANMVVDLGAAPDVDRAGYVSGYVASAFMFGRLLSSFYWGHVSDLVGRKPIIYMSCVAIAVFSIAFGLSVNLWLALASRFLLGFLNPLNTLAKTLISEICSRKHQPLGMAVAAGSWSIGLVVGPAIGGSLARSADLYPGTVLDNQFFTRFPYFLPNAITALFGLISLLLIFCFLPETVASRRSGGQGYVAVSAASAVESSDSQKESDKDGNVSEKIDSPAKQHEISIASNAKALLADIKVQRVCVAYFSISLSAIIYDECLPLWALSSKDKGGLGLSSATIGNVTSITGIPMLIFTFLLFPLLNKHLGEQNCFRYGQLVTNLFAFSTVVISAGLLANNAKLPLLVVVASGEKSFACVAFTATFLLINDSVSAERRASVNGLAMTVGGVAKTLGPMLGGSLYAWSINNGVQTPPFNYMLVFLCCLMIGVVTCFVRFDGVDSDSTVSENQASDSPGMDATCIVMEHDTLSPLYEALGHSELGQLNGDEQDFVIELSPMHTYEVYKSSELISDHSTDFDDAF